eukprot:12827948-Prorocentrum_lima.AAC.1
MCIRDSPDTVPQPHPPPLLAPLLRNLSPYTKPRSKVREHGQATGANWADNFDGSCGCGNESGGRRS